MAVNDRLLGIVAFVQSAEAGSFAVAAERLGVTRSAIGKRIARLEQQLGVRLFHRSTRRQSLTDDGQAYYERCVKALAELDAAEAALDSGRREPSGRLRISAPVLFGRHCVAPVMLELAQRHPKLEIDLSFNDRIVDLVEDGYDLAIRLGRLPDSATLAARPLYDELLGICASPAYLAKHGKPHDVDDFEGHGAVVYGRNGQSIPWLLRDAAGSVREPRIHTRLRFDDVQAIADAAIAGAGLAMLPCWLLSRYVRTGELQMVMHADRVVGTRISAVWPHTHYMPLRTRAAIDLLVERIPTLAGGPTPMAGWSAAA
ncbi:LysR family transcriptional regulator [Pseudomonas sp. CGJS7]|uniref:LysR family transcriptional regulator n=1 Tax=Pseudomonas sp. CGJS7 TaxID=3109348 RepID=UPI00300A72AA